jgi:hypothetical protein
VSGKLNSIGRSSAAINSEWANLSDLSPIPRSQLIKRNRPLTHVVDFATGSSCSYLIGAITVVVLVVSRRHQLLTSIPASCGRDGSSEIEDDCAVAPCFAGETGVSWWCWFFWRQRTTELRPCGSPMCRCDCSPVAGTSFRDGGRLCCRPAVRLCAGAVGKLTRTKINLIMQH